MAVVYHPWDTRTVIPRANSAATAAPFPATVTPFLVTKVLGPAVLPREAPITSPLANLAVIAAFPPGANDLDPKGGKRAMQTPCE